MSKHKSKTKDRTISMGGVTLVLRYKHKPASKSVKKNRERKRSK